MKNFFLVLNICVLFYPFVLKSQTLVGNTEGHGYLYLNGNTSSYSSSQLRFVKWSNGNASIDVMDGNDLYLNYYKGAHVYFGKGTGEYPHSVFKNTGVLGINTMYPTSGFNLDVNGNVRIGTSSSADRNLQLCNVYRSWDIIADGYDLDIRDVTDDETWMKIDGNNNFMTLANGAMYFNQNGNIGIGTTAPDATLHVKGGIAIQNPDLNYDTSGNAGERAGIIFGTNHATNNSMFWISPDANVGNRLNIGTGYCYNDSSPLMTILNTGNTGIGTTSPEYKLDVAGTIRAEEILVEVEDNTADFVFEENYDLKDLSEIEEYIKIHKHLPDIPSAEEMEKSGVNLAEMNKLLLQKVEELTLYTIELQKARRTEKKDMDALMVRIESIENSFMRVLNENE